MTSSGVIEQRCPLCDANSYAPIKSFPDGVAVARCRECGLIYARLRLMHPEAMFTTTPLEALRTYHEPLVSRRFENYRTPAFRRYLAHIARHRDTGKRLLDVGCAHGFFLDEARRAGYETLGIEPSPPAAAFAREELGLDVRTGRLDEVDLGNYQFDVITMTDSLEYLPRPVEDLRALSAHLAPGGVFFAKVPNGDYFMFRRRFEMLRGSSPDSGGAFSPSGRVAHYTAETLARLVERSGMTVTEIGGFAPIDSPTWEQLTGLPLAIRPPRYIGLGGRLTRRAIHGLGMAEETITSGHNHLSQSIAVVARRNRSL